MVVGSRAQVMHGTADKTAGGLSAQDLFYDKYGNIKSRRASSSAKKNQNLGSHQIPKGSGKFVLGGRR